MPKPDPVDYDLNLLTAQERRSVLAAQEQILVPEEQGDIRDLVVREGSTRPVGPAMLRVWHGLL